MLFSIFKGMARRTVYALALTVTADTALAEDGTSVTVLGSLAGQTSFRGSDMGGTSVAIAVNDDRYIVDFGRLWADHYYTSGLAAPGGPRNGFENIRAGFITHMHADHLIDLSHLLLSGLLQGIGKNGPVPIIGPGPRGEAVPLSASLAEAPPEMNPENPYPGTESMIAQLINAYAAALNDVIRDSGVVPPTEVFVPQDIKLPGDLPPPSANVAPPMQPILVYEDENVRVTAILVDHVPTYPSYAYKFETADGTIVVSGDTAITDNLVKFVEGVDIWVNEALSLTWLEEFLPSPRNANAEALYHHIRVSHTPVEEIGPIAKSAGVKKLVLYHLTSSDMTQQDWMDEVSGFDGPVVVGFPLTRVSID